jgi:hypothetical protein
MIQAGDPPKMLQEIMGHASITTTLDLYGHLYPGGMNRYADRLDSAADEASKSKMGPDETRPSHPRRSGPGSSGNDVGFRWLLVLSGRGVATSLVVLSLTAAGSCERAAGSRTGAVGLAGVAGAREGVLDAGGREPIIDLAGESAGGAG